MVITVTTLLAGHLVFTAKMFERIGGLTKQVLLLGFVYIGELLDWLIEN